MTEDGASVTRAPLYCMSAPPLLLLASAASFGPVSAWLFFCGLLTTPILALMLLYFVVRARWRHALFGISAGLILALLIPLNAVSLPLIEARTAFLVVLNGDAYKRAAPLQQLPGGAGSWILGTQGLAEYRLMFTPAPAAMSTIGEELASVDCTVSRRAVGAQFVLVRISCL